jgi:long-chain acyl-CoA synthetase
MTDMWDPSNGNVGGPTPTAEIKLIDIPEMDYLTTDQDENGNLTPRGEVLARGPTCIPCYYKMEEKSRETIDKDGWVHTGDVGMMLPNGCLRIIDRKKNLFKLSIGEYIAPEKIENVYIKIPYIAEVFIHGNSLKNYLVGIFVPDPEPFEQLAKKHNIGGDIEDLCENEKLMGIIYKELIKEGKKS